MPRDSQDDGPHMQKQSGHVRPSGRLANWENQTNQAHRANWAMGQLEDKAILHEGPTKNMTKNTLPECSIGQTNNCIARSLIFAKLG